MTIIKIKHYLNGVTGIIATAFVRGRFTVYVHIYQVDEFGGTVLLESLGTWDGEFAAKEALYAWEQKVVSVSAGTYRRNSGDWGFLDTAAGARILADWKRAKRCEEIGELEDGDFPVTPFPVGSENEAAHFEDQRDIDHDRHSF